MHSFRHAPQAMVLNARRRIAVELFRWMSGTTMSDIDTRLRNLETRTDEAIGTPLWLQKNYTEPRVNYTLRDLIQPGWTCFDVGANFGGLTMTMSRLAGPRGVVCGFEANPVIAAKCQRELLRSGAFTAQLYQGAIFKRSGETIELYLSDNAVADSIYRKTDTSISVQTIALDDFVMRTRLSPQIVKMDIEGAEFDALCGFDQTINTARPIFILEHTPPDNACFDFLRAKGYVAIDLQNYRRLHSGSDVLDGTVVTDVLYAHEDQLIGSPYAGDLSPVEQVRLDASDFSWAQPNLYRSRSLDLQPGRYLGQLVFRASGSHNTMCGVWQDGANAPVMRVHSTSSGLVGFARNTVFDLDHGPAHVFFHFLEETDASLAIESITLHRIPGFDAHREKFSITS
jgi:FkbM family methyltransferase